MKKINTILFTLSFIMVSCVNSVTISNVETKILSKSLQIDSSEYSKIKEQFSIKGDISSVSNDLSSLTPKFALAEIILDGIECKSSKSFIVPSGFLSKKCKKYIIKENNSYKLIEDTDELKKIVAPIDSKEEALSFAVAVSSFYPKYDNFTSNDNPNSTIYKTALIEKTNVKENKDGYIVNLFNDFCFKLTEYIVKINKNGDFEIISTNDIAEDVNNKGVICD